MTYPVGLGGVGAEELPQGAAVLVHNPPGAAPLRGVVASSTWSPVDGGLVVVVRVSAGRAPPAEESVLVTFHHAGDLVVMRAAAELRDDQLLLSDLQVLGRESRRQAPRSLLAYGVVLRPDTGPLIAGGTVDLSTSGCRLVTTTRQILHRDERFPMAIVVDSMDADQGVITCTAEVVWSRPDGELAGIWFGDLAAADRDRLSSAVLARMVHQRASGEAYEPLRPSLVD
jgi:hypothetical protein